MMEDLYEAKITYRGYFADDHVLDAYSLGQSLQGYARISQSIFHLLIFREIPSPQRLRSSPYRLFARAPEKNGVEITFTLSPSVAHQLVLPVLVPLLPEIKFSASQMVSFVLNTLSGHRNMAQEALNKALDILSKVEDHRHEELMAVIAHRAEELAWKNKAAARQLVAPVGKSCKEERLWPDHPEMEYIIDEPTAEVLRRPEDLKLGDPMQMKVLITQINIETGTATVRDVETGEKIKARITDPAVETPHNIYTAALDFHKPIIIEAKPVFTTDNRVKKLYISHAQPAE